MRSSTDEVPTLARARCGDIVATPSPTNGSVMLDKLFGTIEVLKARIEKHRSYFHAGGKPEARTRAALIDPMLSALEWDVTDPDKVEIEPKMEGGRWADYALLGHDREPVLFIEAKKLAESNSEARQVVSYTVTENMERSRTKVRYCAWTNGDTWVVYDTKHPPKKVMQVTISSCESVGQCALNFLGLWYHSMRDNCFSVPVVCSPRPEVGCAEPNDSGVHPNQGNKPTPGPPLAPDGPIQATYQALHDHLLALGDDVKVQTTKHYVAFKRQRNFATLWKRRQWIAVQLLSVDPDTIDLEEGFSRRTRSSSGHSACVEVTIRSREDLRRAELLLKKNYDAAN